MFICGLIFFCLNNYKAEKASAENPQSEIEKAIFVRQEFFGAEVIVPLPTVEAREALAKLAENQSKNPQILEKLAELNEKLELFNEAEENLLQLGELEPSKMEMLAAFYHRRADFEKEAETLKSVLFAQNTKNRVVIFERLIDLARIHELQKYLQLAFYEQVVKENPSAFGIFQKLTEKLTEEKNYGEALKFIRQAKAQFREQKSIWLEKEIEILLAMNKAEEAAAIYQAAFDPFWSNDEAEKFYDFLSNQDRLREYGAELKSKFKKNPADFDTGIRFALYQNHDYIYDNDDVAPIILKIEQAKKDWTTDQLITATRLLLQDANGSLASRFLYTLYLREDFQKNPAQRGKILYQLFKIFSEADSQKLPLTKGDLRFYEDIAKADRNPGIAGGLLSLIFSDTNPPSKLEAQETQANKYFNRAAAYRIFEEYKKESPISSELAQMYLDIVRIYTAAEEPEIAEKILNEFAEKFENSSDYPAAAMKLAEAFSEVKNEEKARDTYHRILDYTGRRGQFRSPSQSFEKNDSSVSSETSDAVSANSSIYSYEKQKPVFYDSWAVEVVSMTYRDALEKLVGSLADEKKTTEILALYSNEIAKYPAEEWLYEERLSWLEQTNLTEEKLESYKLALARFKTNNWRDKLARFFIREKRKAEFTAFSEDLIGKLDDVEIEEYLARFIDENATTIDFKRELYFRLYQSAHQRFPHNIKFINGLLNYYKTNKQQSEWRKLSAEYYFESKTIRENFLSELAEKGELRNYLQTAQNKENTAYELFRADASARLSDFENSVAAYRKLNRLYPHTPEFAERLIAFTRSFGQKNRQILAESSQISKSQADFLPSSAEYRTRSGEIFAELGDYKKSREEWEKLIMTAQGSRETYLDTATVYWDYYQFDDALRTISSLRQKFGDETLYAFEAGAILEAQDKEKEAIGEYIKAFDANRDDDQKTKAQKRLAKLATNRSEENKNEIAQAINSAYLKDLSERKGSSFLTLAYAEFLARIKQSEKAEVVLTQEINRSFDKDFLTLARDFHQTENNRNGERIALKRLAEISKNPRQKIQFQLELAESFADAKDRESAKRVLENLTRKFPTNYGVLSESAAFYQRLGFEPQAINLIETALPQSRGKYRAALAQKLAKLLIRANQFDSAEQILIALHTESKENIDVFRELAAVCVRTGNAALLRKSFDETIKALKETDIKRDEPDEEIAELRTSMIDAFTRLADYRSAIEQHIEMINREPENEQSTENAIRYVKRFGGADILLDYYQKLSAEAFKNYRWNIVLARIYEANNDFENAIKNYQEAIINQPEMVELYLAIAEIETNRSNFDAALKNIDTILELTSDNAVYVKKKIELLQKAGRTAEIAAEKAKLPAEIEKKITENEFAEARKLINSQNEKAREIYRQAFAKLTENPLRESLNSTDIVSYVQAVREEEPLHQINQRLWNLREKLMAIADQADSANAGEARKRISIIDGAMIEAIGNIAKTIGTDEELSALHEDLKNRIAQTAILNDKHQTVSLAQNIAVRAGFGGLEEIVLQKKLEANKTSSEKRFHMQNLVSFYNQRGVYQKTFDVLQKYANDDLPLKAETARLIGNREKELENLRLIYQKPPDKLIVASDVDINRFLEILYSENRDELKSLAEKKSAFQLQLINFLLSRGESRLAHRAIENSGLSTAWKLARNAEASLALREFDENADCYFCDALQFDSIGKMIAQTPDKQRFLINDDWFRLTRQYGEWLYEKNEKNVSPTKFLVAMTENLPENAEEQTKLGVFYLEKKRYAKAIEHLLLADESYAYNEELKTHLGAAYHLAGKEDAATKIWSELFQNRQSGEEVKSSLAFLQTLQKYGLAAQGLEKLPPVIIKFLEANDAEDSEDFQQLIRTAAYSFKDEMKKSAYFLQILKNRPTDKSLARMLISENLIARSRQSDFFRLIIERSELETYPDFEFQSVRQRIFNEAEAEFIYEQENNYDTDEPQNARLTWQRKYLEFLLAERKTIEANSLISEIEADLRNRHARPFWLRKAKMTARIYEGRFDLAEAEQLIGITVPESLAEINAPNLERFNEVLEILKKENRLAEGTQLSEKFFARKLALGKIEIANFLGLARVYFQKNETDRALQVLRLLNEVSLESSKESALAELAALDVIKTNSANAVKMAEIESEISFSQAEALRVCAEIAAEFKQSGFATDFRRKLLNFSPEESSNKIELAKLLSENNHKPEAVTLLNEIISDRNALRSMRWQARMHLLEMGENIEFPNISFDAFSQFHTGVFNKKSNQPEAAQNFFINSLIADREAPIAAREELIKSYAQSSRSFAALKFAENYKEAKSDELLWMLSEAAEKIKDFRRAIEFEKAKSSGENSERIVFLQELFDEQNKLVTDFTVTLENTKKL